MPIRFFRALRGILFSILIRGVIYYGTGNHGINEAKNAERKNAWQRQERQKGLLGADYLEPVVQIPP